MTKLSLDSVLARVDSTVKADAATVTYSVAMAAGKDAGNKSMKRAGRTAWNHEDFNAAAAVTEKLMAMTRTDADEPFKATRADFREHGMFGKDFGDFEYKGYNVYAGEGDGLWHIYRGRQLINKAPSKSAAKAMVEGMKPNTRVSGQWGDGLRFDAEDGGSEGKRPFDRADSVGSDLEGVTTAPDPIADGEVGMTPTTAPEPEPMVLAAGCMVIADNGSILFMKRADTGQWAFPGGGVEDGEGPAEAALRELHEETGLKVSKHAGLLTRRKGDGVDFTTFAVRVPEPFAPKMNGEHTAFAWMRPADLTGPMVLADSLRADDANWREEDHPRAEDGKFGTKSGKSSGGEGEGDKPAPGGEGGQGGGTKAPEGGRRCGEGRGRLLGR